MLGKLCYFREEEASTESGFSGLYLAGTVLFQRCESCMFTRGPNFQRQGSVFP